MNQPVIVRHYVDGSGARVFAVSLDDPEADTVHVFQSDDARKWIVYDPYPSDGEACVRSYKTPTEALGRALLEVVEFKGGNKGG